MEHIKSVKQKEWIKIKVSEDTLESLLAPNTLTN